MLQGLALTAEHIQLIERAGKDLSNVNTISKVWLPCSLPVSCPMGSVPSQPLAPGSFRLLSVFPSRPHFLLSSNQETNGIFPSSFSLDDLPVPRRSAVT